MAGIGTGLAVAGSVLAHVYAEDGSGSGASWALSGALAGVWLVFEALGPLEDMPDDTDRE